MPETVAVRKNRRRALYLVLLAALVLRLLMAAATEGYSYDVNCFTAWGAKLASEGPANFYSEDYFADYPPGYMYVLGLVAAVRDGFGIAWDGALGRMLLALVPALCDCGCAALIFSTAERYLKNAPAVRRLTLFAAFCPMMLFDTAVWKQVDGAFSLPLIACFVLLEDRRWLQSALLYGVALAIKPQAFIAGPVLALCFLAGITRESDVLGRLRALGRTAASALIALAVPMAAGLPFFGVTDLLPSLWEKYLGTASSYPYATVNAFNWFAALGGNWVSLDTTVFGPVTWQTLGNLHIVLLTVALIAAAVVSLRAERFSPLLLSAGYLVGVFTFAHSMHERYLVPGVLLTLLAAARWNDRRLLGAGAGLSFTALVNLSAVYSQNDTDDAWLTSATSALLTRAAGLAETVCCILLLVAVYDIVVYGATVPLVRRGQTISRQPGIDRARKSPAAQPAWTRRELLGLGLLTLATAVVNFVYLGDMTAPQHPLDAQQGAQTVEFTIDSDLEPATLWIYPGVHSGSTLTITDEAGNIVYSDTLGAVFTWQTVALPASTGTHWTAELTGGQVFELSLRGADGSALPVTGGEGLFDEPDAVPETISQLNSMYFDEIYHGRTGYEMLHKMTVYETTHPPLGKDFIMLGIAIFGMTGFGWRFAGTLFGVLLVPLAWCFVRRLTRKPWVAAAAACILALDFMRFSQSRIATIDIYGTFFILLGAHCMVWYAQTALEKGIDNALLPMALGGVAFGCGCAAKWTGIYAGVGLAILYFGVLYARWRRKPANFRQEFVTAAWGGVLFYVLLPFVIYLGAYLPYCWKDPSFGIGDWWNCQVYMYEYHSTLDATHPFESRWYTWLLDLRPVWYYQNSALSADMRGSIAGMGGPVLWLAGLVSILTLAWRQLSGRGSRRGGAVLILYAAQLVPWVFVARCTFLYHYFPSSMFCLAAIGVVLADMKNRRRAKGIAIGLCAASAVLFVWFYPVLSGLPVPSWWAASTLWLPGWGFYFI
ncbi:phospholipid carrier-dependent glycosyltransferase [Subdoligranulum sp. DSM 109015]|uniref:Polyprenol-phosphate-mannose--protein mannosyltransferase n=1 Tax=Gemmiger gallinarum TaxID=2779354 RepID=A0ABR9R6I9_9FIRM|nr:phospholipid carrier-dependent glycosyltransferase [Gemmiger gallinarum]MBE5038380.1 phospholipid carrier-dependent glycosyltransferase [Gemmiger gallinarum]